MADSSVNNLRLSHMIVALELQTLLLSVVMLLTALLVGVIVVIPMSPWVVIFKVHAKCALLPYKGKYSTCFPFELRWYHTHIKTF